MAQLLTRSWVRTRADALRCLGISRSCFVYNGKNIAKISRAYYIRYTLYPVCDIFGIPRTVLTFEKKLETTVSRNFTYFAKTAESEQVMTANLT